MGHKHLTNNILLNRMVILQNINEQKISNKCANISLAYAGSSLGILRSIFFGSLYVMLTFNTAMSKSAVICKRNSKAGFRGSVTFLLIFQFPDRSSSSRFLTTSTCRISPSLRLTRTFTLLQVAAILHSGDIIKVDLITPSHSLP